MCEFCEQDPCVCDVIDQHRVGCRYRRAMTNKFPVKCIHGLMFCEVCDTCNCDELESMPYHRPIDVYCGDAQVDNSRPSLKEIVVLAVFMLFMFLVVSPMFGGCQ